MMETQYRLIICKEDDNCLYSPIITKLHKYDCDNMDDLKAVQKLCRDTIREFKNNELSFKEVE